MPASHAAQTPPRSQESAANGDLAAFNFVQSLAAELSSGRIDFPSFPDIALRVRQALANEDVRPDVVVRVVSSEPALAARLLNIANSAALNFTGKPVTDLRTALARLGFNMVRSAAISFAMWQLKRSESLKGFEKPLDALWRRSTEVAAMSYVVARRFTRVSPDTALLAGLLHAVGETYILARVRQHPALFADPTNYQNVVNNWHSGIAKALLETWGIAEEVVTAVSEFEDLERAQSGPPDLTDVLTVSHLLITNQSSPETIELSIQGVAACQRMNLSAEACAELIQASAGEYAAMRQALGC